MGLFDNKKHIKTTKELRKVLKKQLYLTQEDKALVARKAKKYIRDPSGLSKNEWIKKVVRPLKKDTKDKINPNEARRLRRLA